MFHRRRTPPGTQRHLVPASSNPAAFTAATQAFLKTQESNSALAAAAAGTALRSHTQSPTAVGYVRTKRTQKKDADNRSADKAALGRPGVGLQRRSSSGSMTERTFRSPSPGRGTSPNRTSTATLNDAPPVPALPQYVPDVSTKPHKRAASLEPPLRVSSPTPASPGGRGVSLDRGTFAQTPPPSVGRTQLEQIREVDRENSQRSINFSRPLSPGPSNASPRPQSSHTGWFTTPIRGEQSPRSAVKLTYSKTPDGISMAEASGIQSHLQGVADRPTTSKKKKKKKTSPAEGKHLAAGTFGPKLTGSSVKPLESIGALQTAQDSPVELGGLDQSPQETQTDISLQPARSSERVDVHDPIDYQPPRLRTTTVVENTAQQANTSRKLESPIALAEVEKPKTETIAEQIKEKPRSSSRLSVEPPIQSAGQKADGSDAEVKRAKSISPARKPHFSTAPVELENGIRHQPPPRSTSPVKSALKHSPSSSVRTASPTAPYHPSAEKPQSEVSATDGEDIPNPKRKKSARVSFEEAPDASVNGLNASRHAPSNVLRERSIREDEFEDVMQPRPALPSFGSIRGRRRVEEEPPRPVRGIPPKAPSSMESSATLVETESSKDYAIGSILADDFAVRHRALEPDTIEAPIEPQSDGNLPLPPEVTSVEGSGYVSDSESIYSEKPDIPDLSGVLQHKIFRDDMKAELTDRSPAQEEEDQEATSNSKQVGPVPLITILPATPAAVDEKEEEPILTIPGAFPSSGSSLEVDKEDIANQTAAATPSASKVYPAIADAERFTKPSEETKLEEHPMAASAATTKEDSESSDSSSVYSDAAEDWEEEQRTFASLDALVESPVVPRTDIATESSLAAPLLGRQDAHQSATSTVPTAAGWLESTEYWRSLSDQKKQELETRELIEPTHPKSVKTEQASGQHSTDPVSARSSNFIQVHGSMTSPSAPARIQPAARQGENLVSPKVIQQSLPEEKAPALLKSMQATHNLGGPQAKQVPVLRKTMRADAASEPGGARMIPSVLKTPESLEKSKWAPPAAETSKSGLDTSKHAPSKIRGALQKKHIPPAAAPEPRTSAAVQSKPTKARPVTMQPLQRRGSTDSESSFKRAKRTSTVSQDGVFSLRRTMRTSQTPVVERPMSPVGRGRQMRSSLRASIDSGVPSLRDRTPASPKPSKIPGLGRSKKTQATSPPPPRPFRSRFTSDSDDEDDERGPPLSSRFRSRFDDSDDELDSPLPVSPGLPLVPRPVRGLPRRATRDSSDLDEVDEPSSAEPSPRPRMKTKPAVPSAKDIEAATNGKLAPAQGHALALGTMRKGTGTAAPAGLAVSKHAPAGAEQPHRHKRRFSLPGFGRKKRESSVPPAPSTTADGTEPADPSNAAPTEKPRIPRLHRRATPVQLPQLPERTDGDDDAPTAWPLPPAPRFAAADAAKDRPSTSDGAPARPVLGSRRPTADDASQAGSVHESGVAYGRSGRRKRFPMLRRAFGLTD